MSDVKAELLKATGVKPKKNEDEQDFLNRIVKAVGALDDDAWSDLSEAAQQWANDATKKVKAKKDIPGFPDDEEEEEDEKPAKKKTASKKSDEEEEEDDEDDKPAKKKGGKDDKKSSGKKKSSDDDEDDDGEESEDDEDEKPAKKKDDKKSDKKKPAAKEEKKEPTKRGSGVTARIKDIMLEDPKISVDDLTEALTEAGFENISNMTVTTVRADFRHTLKIMHSKKALSKDLMAKMAADD